MDKELRKLKKVKIKLMRTPQFVMWQGIMMLGDTSISDAVPTACTDGRNEIYGRAFIKELEEKEIGLEITDAAREYLGEKGFDPVLGARPLRRLIQNEVEDILSDELLGGKIKAGGIAVIDLDEGKIVCRAKEVETEAEPEESEPATSSA